MIEPLSENTTNFNVIQYDATVHGKFPARMTRNIRLQIAAPRVAFGMIYPDGFPIQMPVIPDIRTRTRDRANGYSAVSALSCEPKANRRTPAD